MESMPEKQRLLMGADYKGRAKEMEALPATTGIRLFHAHQCKRDAHMEMITHSIIGRTEDTYKTLDFHEMDCSKAILRKLFKNSNKVIKETRGSLIRFHEKIKENKSQQQVLIKQIEDVRRDVLRSDVARNEMEQYVNLYSKKYTFFLERVTELDQDFQNVQEVLNRYETLENCREECSRVLRGELEETIELKKEMHKIVEEKSNILRKLDNLLVMLRIRQKQAKEKLSHWEHVLELVRHSMSASILESQMLKDGCYDLYVDMCHRRKVTPTTKPYDIENQLKFIQKTILFYKDVFRIATTVKQDQLLILKSKHYKKKMNMINTLLNANQKERI